jgi:hypothetical protein
VPDRSRLYAQGGYIDQKILIVRQCSHCSFPPAFQVQCLLVIGIRNVVRSLSRPIDSILCVNKTEIRLFATSSIDSAFTSTVSIFKIKTTRFSMAFRFGLRVEAGISTARIHSQGVQYLLVPVRTGKRQLRSILEVKFVGRSMLTKRHKEDVLLANR